MAILADARGNSGFSAIEIRTKALRTTNAPRGQGYTLSATSGLIAAASAAGSCFWAMRINPSSGAALSSVAVFVEKIRLQYTTIAAYTTPITVGRRLSLFRGSGAATTGGTTLTPAQKDSSLSISQVASANGGDARIATTGPLSIASIAWEANPFREMHLAHLGAAGSNNEDIYDFNATSPIILQNGQLLGLRCPQAMDAGGTFAVSIDVDYHESVGWNSAIQD